jgi:hypothetical protein
MREETKDLEANTRVRMRVRMHMQERVMVTKSNVRNDKNSERKICCLPTIFQMILAHDDRPISELINSYPPIRQ